MAAENGITVRRYDGSVDHAHYATVARNLRTGAQRDALRACRRLVARILRSRPARPRLVGTAAAALHGALSRPDRAPH